MRLHIHITLKDNFNTFIPEWPIHSIIVAPVLRGPPQFARQRGLALCQGFTTQSIAYRGARSIASYPLLNKKSLIYITTRVLYFVLQSDNISVDNNLDLLSFHRCPVSRLGFRFKERDLLIHLCPKYTTLSRGQGSHIPTQGSGICHPKERSKASKKPICKNTLLSIYTSTFAIEYKYLSLPGNSAFLNLSPDSALLTPLLKNTLFNLSLLRSFQGQSIR